jgi:hypothetical protein
MRLVILSGFIFIIFGESLYINNYILKNNRDLGILKFASAINKFGIRDDLYYLSADLPLSLYRFTEEKAILQVALEDNGASSFELLEIKDLEEIPFKLNDFYLAKSPYISQEEFDTLCKRHLLTYKLLIESNIINFPENRPQSNDVYIKMYFLKRQLQ